MSVVLRTNRYKISPHTHYGLMGQAKTTQKPAAIHDKTKGENIDSVIFEIMTVTTASLDP